MHSIHVGSNLSNRAKDEKNIRISADAWNYLRRAKFELKTKSYSETIEKLKGNVGKSLKQKLETRLNQQGFDEDRHRVNVKFPEDTSDTIKSSKRPKTIMVNEDAQRILEEIKLDSGLSGYSYSDAIEFLITENNILFR
jgi:predicted CopG family antitoxin